MKKLQILLSIFFVLNVVYAQNQVSLTFKYKFLNSNAGYTYPTKMEVYRNGNKIGQSSVKDQTEPNQVTVDFPKGNATITATVFAKVNNKWEARTIANNYGLDFQYNKSYNWTKDATIEMVYNISSVTLDINEPDYLKKIKNTSPVIENSEDEEYGSLSDDLDKYKSNIDIMNSSSSSTNNYQASLNKLNDFLKPMDAEMKKWIEVKDGYIIEHFRGKYTSKAKISDIEGVEKDDKYNVVHLNCKNKSKCVYSDYMQSYYDYFNYNCSSASQMNKVYDLMTEFWYQLTGKKTPVKNNENLYTDYYLDNYKSNSNSKTSGYQTSLNKLNEFLKTFDKGFYLKLEVIDGYIFTRFENGYFNQFKMQDMQDAVVDEANHKVLFKCKGDIYCQTTTWKKNSNYYSHFIDENATHEQLVKLRDLLNAFKKDYLDAEKKSSSSNNIEKYTESSEFLNGIETDDNSTTSSKSRRDEEANKRLENSNKAGSKNKKQEDDLDWEDEDFDAMASTAVELKNSTKKLEDDAKKNTIKSGTQVKLIKVYEKSDQYKISKKYIGKIGTAESDLTPDGEWCGGKIKFQDGTIINYFFSAQVEVVGTTTKSNNNQVDEEDEDDDLVIADFNKLEKPLSKLKNATSNYEEALKKLNDYLPVFNKDVYKNIEVKDGDVYFYFYVFNELYYSRISIIGLKEKTNLVAFSKESKVKLVCKNENKCFWSTYADEYKDHFQFFPKDNTEGISTIQKLLDNFIKAL
ncbi:MAG TPA: hypothetical protein PKO18_05910 [Chitinophagales bacterium]|nr:hypothetical protein [Chitinophagales bacterium]